MMVERLYTVVVANLLAGIRSIAWLVYAAVAYFSTSGRNRLRRVQIPPKAPSYNDEYNTHLSVRLFQLIKRRRKKVLHPWADIEPAVSCSCYDDSNNCNSQHDYSYCAEFWNYGSTYNIDRPCACWKAN